MILAAGRGTRMWPLTDNTPKPLLPLGGTTIIQRQIEELTKVGVKEIHVLIGYRMKAISNHLGNGEKLGVKIKYIIQEKQKGTGHAVLQANGKIKGGFYCLNGDIVVDGSNLDRMDNGKNEIVMMTTEVEDGFYLLYLKSLRAWADWKVDRNAKVQYPNQAKYKSYSRKDRDDEMSLVRLQDFISCYIFAF